MSRPNPIFEDLNREGLLSDDSLANIHRNSSSSLFSVHWELKTLLYLGVMTLSSGLGILVYKNIDSIGHQAVLAIIGLIAIASFAWCYRYKSPFSPEKTQSPNSLSDYILLLGVLSLLSFTGYLQFQYEFFGTRYGLATFIPMVCLFFIAYYFDHLGVLTMAIANLALWMGVSVTPKLLLTAGNFHTERSVYTYFVLGSFLLALSYFSDRYHFKKHFSFTYHHLGLHLTFLSLISGYFFYDYLPSLIWMILIMITAWFLYRDALKQKSFYFLLLTVLYAYIAISALVLRSLFTLQYSGTIYFSFLYFIFSGFMLIRLLMYLNKKLRRHDHL